jgi:hypothetical protein
VFSKGVLFAAQEIKKENDHDEANYVTIEALAKVFTTPAWS